MCEDQLRLFLWGSILEDNQSLKFYNINNHSVTLVVERLRGGARTRWTVVLRANNNSEVDLDSSDESSKDDERTGKCNLFNWIVMHGTLRIVLSVIEIICFTCND